MKKIILISLMFSYTNILAIDDTEYYVTIAQEACDSGLYQLAIDKCKEVLIKFPDNADCKEITSKGNTALKKVETDKRVEKEKHEARVAAEETAKKQKCKQMKCSTVEAAYNICHYLVSIEYVKNIINRENKVGEKGGFVDKRVLHDASRKIVFDEEQLAENRKAYRKTTGKNFDETQCKGRKYNTGENANHPIDKAYEKCQMCLQ